MTGIRGGRHRARPVPAEPGRRRLSTAVTACAVCAGAILPVAIASATPSPVLETLVAEGVVRDGTNQTNPHDHYPDLPAATVMVVTPGTDDTTLYPRINPLIGKRETVIVVYPESFGPFTGGRSGAFGPFAPSYEQSKKVAVEGNRRVMTALGTDRGNGPHVVYTGFSQGADALGDALEQAHAAGTDLSNSRVILVSDPRGPWGIKPWLAGTPLASVSNVIGVTSNGVRDPGASGDVPVTSVIIVGDPVGNFQWDPRRPLSSLLVNAAGFLTIHAGAGSQNYGTLDTLGPPTEFHSVSGNTTYQIYNAVHPLAQVVELVHRELGIPYTATDLQRWNAQAEAFYPMQRPTAANAAVPVVPVTTPTTSNGYQVTMPAEVATGAAPAGAVERQVESVHTAAPEAAAPEPESAPTPQQSPDPEPVVEARPTESDDSGTGTSSSASDEDAAGAGESGTGSAESSGGDGTDGSDASNADSTNTGSSDSGGSETGGAEGESTSNSGGDGSSGGSDD